MEIEKLYVTVGANIQEFSRKMGLVGQKLGAIGGIVGKLKYPLMAAGGAVVKFGADFEKAMTQSTAIMGNLSDEMRDKMETAAREVAKTTEFSAKEAAEAYYFLASAGLDATQSIAAMPAVAAFAQAGQFDLAQATDLLTDAQSALGLASADAAENLANMTRVSDVLVKANTLANASVQQFSEALTSKLAAALKGLDKDVEEGTAALAALADQGLKGAAAGEALTRLLEELQVKALDNAAAFEAAGVAVYDTAGNMRNIADIIADVETATEGLTDEQKTQLFQELGLQKRSMATMKQLLGTSDAIREYEKALRDAGGTTEDVAEKQLQNFWSQLGLAKDRLIDVGLTVWENLGPPMSQVVMGTMDTLEPIFLTLGETVGKIFEQFGPVLQETLGRFGELLGRVLGKVAESGILEDLAEIASILADNILGVLEDLLPPLTDALNLFLDIVTPVIQVADKMGLIKTALYAIIATKVAHGISSMVSGFAQMAGYTAGSAQYLGIMAGKVALVGAGIAAAVPLGKALGEAIEGTNKALEGMEEGMDGLVAKWDEMGQAARQTAIDQLNVELEKAKALCGENSMEAINLSNAINELERGFDSSVETIRNWHDRFSEDMLDSVVVGSSAWDQMLDDAEQFGKDMSEGTNNLHGEIIGMYMSQNEKLHGLAVDGAKGFVEGKMEGWRDVGPDAMEDIKTQLFDIIANPDEYKEKGTGGIHELLMGMADKWGIDREKIIEIEDDILNLLGLEGQAGPTGTAVGNAFTSGAASAIENYDWEGLASRTMSRLRSFFGGGITVPITTTGEGGKQSHMGAYIMHSGGVVPNFDYGGLNWDEVSATLLKGEGVLNRFAMRKLGVANLNAMNAGRMPGGGDTIQNFDLRGSQFTLPNAHDAESLYLDISKKMAQQAALRGSVKRNE